MAAYTKKSLISMYRNRFPEDTANDEQLFLNIMRANPQLKNEVSDYNKEMGKSYAEYLPKIIREGYNRSLTGTADELVSGRKRFDMKDWNPGVVEDLAASVISLMVPTDWMALGPVGKVAGTVGKVALKSFTGAGVPGKLATKAVRKAIAGKIGAGSGVFATYEGLGNALRQQIDTGEIDFEKVGERAMHGAVLGAVSGGIGGTLTARGASSLTKVAAEVGAIGSLPPLFEGELPTPQDYLHTAGIVLGVKGGSKLFSSPAQIKKLFEQRPSKVRYKMGKDEARSYAERIEKHDIEAQLYKDTWVSDIFGSGKKGFGKVQIDRKTNNDTYILRDISNNKSMSMKTNTFHKLFTRKESQKSMEDIRTGKINDINKLEKELGYSKTTESQQISRKRVFTNKDSNYATLNGATDAQLFNYRKKLQLESNIKRSAEKLQSDGVEVVNVPKDNFVDAYLPKAVAKFLEPLRGAEMRIKDPMGRKYVLDVNNFLTRKAELFSKLVERGNDIQETTLGRVGRPDPTRKELRNLGFNKNRRYKDNLKDYWENITELKEQGKLPEWDFLTNSIWKMAKEAGIEVPGKVQNYVPYMLKPEIAEIIFHDTMKIANKINSAANLFDSYKNTKGWIKNNPEKARQLETLIRNAQFDKTTQTALKRNMEAGEFAALRAFAKVGRASYNDLFNPFGNLEKARDSKGGAKNLPKEFYERDWRALYNRYAYGASKRIAEVEFFGKRGEKFAASRKAVEARDNRHEADIMQNIHEHVTGSIHKNPARNYAPKVKEAFNTLMQFETSTKIALGTATIPNITQPMISSMLDAGYWRFFKGIASLTDPRVRKLIRESGATEYNLLNEMIGTSARTGLASNITNALSKWSGFTGINMVNQWTAAATGRVFIKDLHKMANTSKIQARRGWAIDKLARMGLSHKTAFKNLNMSGGITRFAKDMNLQKDILKDPLILSNPKSAPFTQFKRFGPRQFKLIQTVLGEDLKRGNVLSMLRMGVAGYAGGAFVITAKKYLKKILSGEDIYEPDGAIPEDFSQFMNSLAAVGALGMQGDILSSAFDVVKSPTKAMAFLFSPTPLQEIENSIRLVQGIESDASTYGPDAIKRLPSRFANLLGQTPSMIMRRFETEGMTEERLTGQKSYAVTAINKLIDNGEWDRAMEDVREWNSTNPSNPITTRSIGFSQILKRRFKKVLKQRKNKLQFKFDDVTDLYKSIMGEDA